MCNEVLALEIKDRIHELRSEQIMLRPFIASDQTLYEALDKAIAELSWVLARMEEKGK